VREDNGMNLTAYFSKIRELEAELPEPCVVVSSETANGGKAGVRTEASRRVAARMIVEGAARAATAEEAEEFQREKTERKRLADQLAVASRMQLTMVPASELYNLRGPVRGEE
jgi:hypothetical protein